MSQKTGPMFTANVWTDMVGVCPGNARMANGAGSTVLVANALPRSLEGPSGMKPMLERKLTGFACPDLLVTPREDATDMAGGTTMSMILASGRGGTNTAHT